MDIEYIIPPWEDVNSECYGCKHHTKEDCDSCVEEIIAAIQQIMR